MVWMTMLGRLTGSSGLPANETRGRRIEGNRGSEYVCHNWWQMVEVGPGSIWTLVNSCQERQSRTTGSKLITLRMFSFSRSSMIFCDSLS